MITLYCHTYNVRICQRVQLAWSREPVCKGFSNADLQRNAIDQSTKLMSLVSFCTFWAFLNKSLLHTYVLLQFLIHYMVWSMLQAVVSVYEC